MTHIKSASCATCMYLDKTSGSPHGAHCRRYPPGVNSVVVPTAPDLRNPNGGVSVASQIVYPVVRDEDWCGEYRSPLKGL